MLSPTFRVSLGLHTSTKYLISLIIFLHDVNLSPPLDACLSWTTSCFNTARSRISAHLDVVKENIRS
jgi:hypothetical protein